MDEMQKLMSTVKRSVADTDVIGETLMLSSSMHRAGLIESISPKDVGVFFDNNVQHIKAFRKLVESGEVTENNWRSTLDRIKDPSTAEKVVYLTERLPKPSPQG